MTQDEGFGPYTHEDCVETAQALVAAFSGLHPSVVMNLGQWSDLIEMIERDFRHLLLNENVSGLDLLPKKGRKS